MPDFVHSETGRRGGRLGGTVSTRGEKSKKDRRTLGGIERIEEGSREGPWTLDIHMQGSKHLGQRAMANVQTLACNCARHQAMRCDCEVGVSNTTMLFPIAPLPSQSWPRRKHNDSQTYSQEASCLDYKHDSDFMSDLWVPLDLPSIKSIVAFHNDDSIPPNTLPIPKRSVKKRRRKESKPHYLVSV